MSTDPGKLTRIWRRHGRLLTAFGLGVAVSLASGWLPLPLGVAGHLLLGMDVLFVVYLLLTVSFLRLTPEQLREHAEDEDEGAFLATLIAVLAVSASLWGILQILLAEPAAEVVEIVLAFAAVPLSWTTVNMLASLRYAHLHWRREDEGEGFNFPGDRMPGPVDFLYLGFGVGTAAQVADVETLTAAARRAVMAHSVAAFFMNTVIVALAVTAAGELSP